MVRLRNSTGNQKLSKREESKAHQRSVAMTLEKDRNRHQNKDASMSLAYKSGAYTMAETGHFFRMHYDEKPGSTKTRGQSAEDAGILELTLCFAPPPVQECERSLVTHKIFTSIIYSA